MIYFITGNKNKLEEVQSFLSNVEQLDIDLPEIQDVDAHEIIKAKLQEATKHTQGEFIVEDTSLYLDCLNGLPGPLIKWFLKAIGNDGLFNLAEKLGDVKATAKTMIGYAKEADDFYFFEGIVEGKIVKPQTELGFGWDSIFLPDGYQKTFVEMTKEEKNKISMRSIAVSKLKEFLRTQ